MSSRIRENAHEMLHQRRCPTESVLPDRLLNSIRFYNRLKAVVLLGASSPTLDCMRASDHFWVELRDLDTVGAIPFVRLPRALVHPGKSY